MIIGRVQHLTLAASIVAIILGAASMSQAQWERCGPQGGAVTTFAVMGSRILAGTGGNYYNQAPGSGIFISNDSGLTWAQSNAGLTDTTVYALGVSRTYVLASTASGNLFRSSDRGASWQLLPKPATSQPISSFATAGNYLFAVTGADGVLRSTDNGISWWRPRKGFNVMDIHTIAVMDTVLFANGGWDDTGGVYRSTDYGKTWSEVYNSVFDITTLGNKLFAAMYHTVSLGVNVSTDQGATWSQTENGGCGVYDQMAAAGSIVFSFHSQNGVSYSTDSGADWISSNALQDFYCAAAMGDIIFVGNQAGVLRSTDFGNSWDTTTQGMYMFAPGFTGMPSALGGIHNVLYGTEYSSAVNQLVTLRSTDGGANWTEDSVLTDTGVSVYATMGNTILAANGWGIFRSDDEGQNWTQFFSDVPFDRLLVAGPMLFGASDYAGMFRSSDTGKTWVNISQGLASDPEDGWDQMQIATNGSTIYAAPSALFASTDWGKTWKNLTGGLMLNGVSAISASGANICVAGGIFGDSSTIFVSRDAGKSWSANVPIFPRVNCLLQSETSVLAATNSGPMFSQDNGSTWTFAGTGILPDSNSAFSFAIMDSTIYASTANGIWKEQRSQIPFAAEPAAVKDASVATTVELSPNPTTGLLTISGSYSSIIITNLLGEPVLRATYAPAGTLDLSRLPAGTYFVRIVTASGVVVRKIVKE